MTAKELKLYLTRRYPGGSYGGMAGAWTCIEEWMGIDLLAWSAWASKEKFGRIGHEVKVTRTDLRKELLRPGKRARAVAWCHQFYFAVPDGLLTTDELAYEEPEWESTDWIGEACPGYLGQRCRSYWRRKTTKVDVPVPTVGYVSEWRGGAGWEQVPCPTCNGKGAVVASRVEREAPTCWVPRDVGLIVVYASGITKVVKRSPRRAEVPKLADRDLAQLVRWISMRPDPRHQNHPISTLDIASGGLVKGIE